MGAATFVLWVCLQNWGNNWCAPRYEFDSAASCQGAVEIHRKALRPDGETWHCSAGSVRKVAHDR